MSLLLNVAAAGQELPLVPLPRNVQTAGTSVTLAEDWKIAAQTPADRIAAALIAEDIERRYAWKWEVIDGAADNPSSRSVVQFIVSKAAQSDPPLYKTQGYKLTVDPAGSITIEAPSDNGRYYGAQTLRQLIRATVTPEFPGLNIHDWPEFEYRGISDDISRGQVSTIEDFQAIIRELAYYKKNLYQPYIEDMFEFSIDPNIGRTRGHITKAEMAQMVEEAKKHHVIVCPVFESLGHQDRLLALPENRRYAEMDDPAKLRSFAPAKPEAIAFVKKLIDEVAEAAPSPFFHIGGDESWDVGKGASMELVEKLGAAKVHAQYFGDLINHIKEKHGRRTMLYSDMLLHHLDKPEELAALPKDAIWVDWHYWPSEKYESIAKLKAAGYNNVLISPAIWGWYSFYPNYRQAFENIGRFTDAGRREGVMGSITSAWGDRGSENLRENNMVGYAFSAAAEWETTATQVDSFLNRFAVTRYGAEGVHLAGLEKTLGWPEEYGSLYYGDFYHEQPRIRRASEDLITTMGKFAQNMRDAMNVAFQAREQVKWNADHLDVLNHVAQRILYMAQRTLHLDNVYRMLDGKSAGDLNPDLRRQLMLLLDELRSQSINITAEFERLWLRRNKFPMLQDNTIRLQKQTAELQDMFTRAQSGELRAPGEPDASWIWYPEPDATTSASTGTKYFVRTFDLSTSPALAELKCYADDRAEVFINGSKAAETQKAVQSANVFEYLRAGRNVIAVEAENRKGAAGILLRLNIRTEDGKTFNVTGDEKWRCSEEANENWTTSEPSGAGWKPAAVLGKGLIAPWTQIAW